MKIRIERENFEKAVSNFGKSNIKEMLNSGKITVKELSYKLNISRTSKLFLNLLKELEIKVPKTSILNRRMNFIYREDYWNIKELVEILKIRLLKPTLNSNSRYIITFSQHPRASKAKQVKAHIIVWEIANKKNLPINCGIFFKDGNSLNIQEENLECKPLTEIKSIRNSLDNNIFWKGGQSKYHNYYGGWKRISRENLCMSPICKICNSKEDLLIHHILPYSLFNNYKLAHSNENLLVVCRHCHGKIHYNLENSWRHIDENQYEKLLKLLEHLKSQSSDNDLEIFRAIEQQIEQTDDQQPSFLTCNDAEEGSETILNGSRVVDNSKKEDSL